MNPLLDLIADINRRSNTALDMAERVMRRTQEMVDDDYTLEPGDTDQFGHTYDDPEWVKLDKLANEMNRENIVYIHGIAHEIESYSEPNADGSRSATLRVWKPF